MSRLAGDGDVNAPLSCAQEKQREICGLLRQAVGLLGAGGAVRAPFRAESTVRLDQPGTTGIVRRRLEKQDRMGVPDSTRSAAAAGHLYDAARARLLAPP